MPDPTNPQSINRYTYGYNNAEKYTDPSGHCAGVRGNPNSDGYDAACWQFLETEFCNIVECGADGWKDWLQFWDWGQGGAGIFLVPWVIVELTQVASSLQNTIDALASIGVDWKATNLSNTWISKGDRRGTSYYNGRNLITLHSSHIKDERVVYHELGHALGLEYEFEAETNGGCTWVFCRRYAAPGYYFREYGRSASNPNYSAIKEVFARPGETWADAFSVFVYKSDNQGANPSWTAIDVHMSPNWDNIYAAVANVLAVLR